MKARAYDRLAATLSVLLVAALAGFSYYLAELSRQGEQEVRPRNVVHEPDYFVEQFMLTRLNKQGEPMYRMSAERMVHYPDDDSFEFQRPMMVSLNPDKPRMTLQAARGTSTAEGEVTHLHGNVEMVREAGENQPRMTVETDYMMLRADQDIASSDKPVRIQYGESTLTGVGMEFNNATRQLRVDSRVRGRWTQPPR